MYRNVPLYNLYISLNMTMTICVDAQISQYSMHTICIYLCSLSREQLLDAQVNYILDEIVMAGMVLETNADLILEAIKDTL